MNEILQTLSDIGIVPVVVINDAKDALPLAKALIDGGLPCAEVTFRTAAAEDAIRMMASAYPEMLIGAGTVLTAEQADKAVKAGAKFIVSPGLNPEVVKHCLKKGYTVTPGTSNPSDVEAALALGLDVVKFFPAEANGGVKMLKNLLGAFRFSGVKFMPTGGINPDNLRDYLSVPEVAACGGTWIVPGNALDSNDLDAIRKLAAAASKAVREVRPGTAAADKNAAR